jgi:SWI/SNF-related matrix-associated actin-dependent regulator 1 of chromatin subfamily A
MAAQVAREHFPPSAAITVAAMNVDLNERPMAWMPSESFPTLQMFNRRGGAAASVAHKLGGAQCSHLAGLAPSALPAHAPGSLPASSTATPPCVPSLDFTHPTAPGKMALPSVAALVAWMAANCSAPFELRKLRVPAQAVRGSRQRSPWASAFFPAAEGAAAAAAAEAPAAAAAAAAAAASGGDTVPLSALLEDMDAECKVFEAGVFDSMFAGHVVELVTAATASPPLPAAAGWAAALAAARAHAAAQAQWMQAGKDIRAYGAKEGPAPALGGLPGVGGSSAWLQGHLPRLQASALALKEAVQGPAVAYGAADAAWVAMEAAHEQSQACGAREVARAWMQDQDSMRCVAAALPMALALAEEEGRQRVA